MPGCIYADLSLFAFTMLLVGALFFRKKHEVLSAKSFTAFKSPKQRTSSHKSHKTVKLNLNKNLKLTMISSNWIEFSIQALFVWENPVPVKQKYILAVVKPEKKTIRSQATKVIAFRSNTNRICDSPAPQTERMYAQYPSINIEII